MNDEQWEVLAEININDNINNEANSIHCLCTRSLVYSRVIQQDDNDFNGILCAPEKAFNRLHVDDREIMETDETLNAQLIEWNEKWEKHWAENGEQIIWKSWIEKYGEYINTSHRLCATENMDEAMINASTAIVISPSSQKENPIVQTPVDDKQNDEFKDTLAIPRCDSTSSSKPPTIGTTDSMTNVTQMTMSSNDFCQSPSRSASITPLTESPCDDDIDIDQIVKVETINEDEADRRWQELWHENFQEQYTQNYTEFISEKQRNRSHSSSVDQDYSLQNDDFDDMTCLGLPLEFGKKTKIRCEFTQPSIEQYLTTDRLRAAFALMGYSFLNNNSLNGESSGTVVYRKRNIQHANNSLIMKKIRMDERCEPTKVESGDEESPIERTEEVEVDEDDDKEVLVTESTSEVQLPRDNKKKKKNRKNKNKRIENIPPEIAADKTMLKYWHKRFSLFSRFDEGIKLDHESWFSVTPEKIAIHTAIRCQSDIIVDAFCGAGGNTIQFAKKCRHVIAIDMDPLKIELAKHNASIYGVRDKIDFVVGDFFQLAEHIRADAVFLSPPWGGPKYINNKDYDIEKHLQPRPATEMMKVARVISKNICLFLPRNTNTHQLAMLAGPGQSVEVEQNFLNNKLSALTAFYGNLIKQKN